MPTTIDHEDAEACVSIIDTTTTASVTYFGLTKTIPASKAAAIWQVRKQFTNSDGDSEIAWADGTPNYDNIWDNRASLTYAGSVA